MQADSGEAGEKKAGPVVQEAGEQEAGAGVQEACEQEAGAGVQHNESNITDMDDSNTEIPRGQYISAIDDLYATRSITKSQKDEILSKITQRYPIDHHTVEPNVQETGVPEAGEQHNETVDRELSSITEWPLKERCTSDYPNKIKLNLCNSDIPSEMNKKYQRSYLKSDGHIYKMSAKKRGNVLVINNEKFKKLSTRHGTKVDADAIKVLFDKLNFTVARRENLSKKNMRKVLQKFGKMNHSEFDCFICFILSHGEEESITCVDGTKLPLNEIFNYFKGDKCPSLKGKPKVFFIQACKNGSTETADCKAIAGEWPHKDADFFMFYSTTPGSKAYRHPDYGSRFIYTWIYIIEKWAYKRNLMDLQRMVTNLIQTYKPPKPLQTTLTQSTSGKEFYFFPGLPVDAPPSKTAIVQKTQLEVREFIPEEKTVESTMEYLAASSNISQSVASSSAATSGAENNMSASMASMSISDHGNN